MNSVWRHRPLQCHSLHIEGRLEGTGIEYACMRPSSLSRSLQAPFPPRRQKQATLCSSFRAVLRPFFPTPGITHNAAAAPNFADTRSAQRERLIAPYEHDPVQLSACHCLLVLYLAHSSSPRSRVALDSHPGSSSLPFDPRCGTRPPPSPPGAHVTTREDRCTCRTSKSPILPAVVL